jgi:hypothetical protein
MYEAVRFSSLGGRGVDPADPLLSDGAVIARGSLTECRAAVQAEARRLGHRAVRWADLDDDDVENVVEAYNDGPEEGCGGWVIRRVSA